MCAAANVIKKISAVSDVVGLTSVDDKLYVLLERDNDQVAVYSINNYQLLRHLNVPGLKTRKLNDITSCVRYKCLYMSEFDYKCVHRYELASNATSKWPVCGSPRGLSLTPSGNLLVTCRSEPAKLVELRANNGQCVREIELQSNIMYPQHSVQLTTSQFLVSYRGDLHRVSAVGDDGKVTRSYGDKLGSDVGRLNWPRHLAVDKDSQFVFVADRGNHRVVLLSPMLEFVRYIIKGLPEASRLYFHEATRRLFVVHGGRPNVTVIQL